MVRCKFMLTHITEQHYNRKTKTLRFQANYDPSIPEDQRFYDASPNGHLEVEVNNPAALEQLKLGQAYYLDLIECPPAA